MKVVSRRVFIRLTSRLAAAASGWVVLSGCAAPSQAPTPTPLSHVKIGYISPDPSSEAGSPLWPALARFGWRLGDNLELDFHFAYTETVDDAAVQLVKDQVNLILTQGEPASQAAKAATNSIPIVMVGVSDALAGGLVANLARPGGNITGVTMLGPEVAAKRVELLHELAPSITRVAVLWNPAVLDTAREFRNLEPAAQALQLEMRSLQVTASEAMIQRALAAIMTGGVEGLVVSNAASLWEARDVILRAAASKQIPTIYPNTAWVMRGGLISYGPELLSMFSQVAQQIDKILRGARPADVPVERPRSFECGVNTRTVASLGLTISPSLAAIITQRF
jgi:putative ABC transport system substrate-binding protein